MSSNSSQELQLLSIERQQQIVQNLYIFLLQKREENELAALINVGNTRVIMSPNGSNGPVEPRRMIILCTALLLGCGIPFAFFFLKKRLDFTVKNKGDLGHLSVPFLVEIPRVVEEDDRLIKLKFKKDNRKDYSKIFVQHGSRDVMNEAFRVFRTNLDLVLNKESKSHVIMMTSFNPNAGKTFTIMNIAASMALKGAKTLLVDLDLRKATLGKALDVNQTGVAAYLNGKSADYHSHIVSIDTNLDILPKLSYTYPILANSLSLNLVLINLLKSS
jgi:hypothetical protein